MELKVKGLDRLKLKFLKADRVAQAEVRRVLQAFGRRMEGQIKARTPVATGRLRASIKYAIVEESKNTFPILVIGSMTAPGGGTVRYAAMREFGGVIKAKNGKYLAWAFTAKGFKNPLVTPAGVSGVRARDLGSAGLSAGNNFFDMTGTFVLPKGPAARKVMFAKFKGGGYMPLFMLAKQVKQKGSHYLYPVVERNVPVIGKAIQIAIKKLLTEK